MHSKRILLILHILLVLMVSLSLFVTESTFILAAEAETGQESLPFGEDEEDLSSQQEEDIDENQDASALDMEETEEDTNETEDTVQVLDLSASSVHVQASVQTDTSVVLPDTVLRIQEYSSQDAAAIKMAAGLGLDESQELFCFDISLCQNEQVVEPSAPVQISITVDLFAFSSTIQTEGLQLFHQTDSGIEW